MPLGDFLTQFATIQVDSLAGQAPPTDALGGVDRSRWNAIVQDVPCMEKPYLSKRIAARNSQTTELATARIYFAEDPIQGRTGLGIGHRIIIDNRTYAVMGVQNPNMMNRIFQVNCQRVVTDDTIQ